MTVIHIIRREIYSKVFKKLRFSCNSPRLSGHRFRWRFWIVDPVCAQFSRQSQNFFSDPIVFHHSLGFELFKTQKLDHFASE